MGELSEIETVLRLLAAGALGGAIGFEREFSDQPAGFRTHILVALGSALFTMVGAYGLQDFFDSVEVRYDPTRIAAQIVTGIGFLGAGAILQRGIRVRGLTTAAALWVTAAIGMAAGFGYWTGAVTTAVISLIALYLLKLFQRRYLRVMRGNVHMTLEADHGFNLARFEQTLAESGAELRKMSMTRTEYGHQVAVTLSTLEGVSHNVVVESVSSLPDVDKVDWRLG
ncbi:MAG: MgtC/SapB family protein [Actinomycetota bacterium]